MQDIQSTPTLLPVLRTEKIHLVSGHSSLAQKPGWRYCITMLEGAYGGIPSCFQVGHSCIQLGRKETRIPAFLSIRRWL